MKNKKVITKISSSFLLGIYFFLLTVITFHHHPHNLAKEKSLFNTAPTETSTHHYTTEQCPIINFANNGFSSTVNSNIFINILFESFQYTPQNNNSFFIEKFDFSFQHRAPPLKN